MPFISIETAIFRANPRYTLVLFDQLPTHARDLLRDLEKDADLYGLLRPHADAGLESRAEDRDTAQL
jgi:hypothetical protein